MRNIVEVIFKMVNHIPPDELRLIQDLASLANDFSKRTLDVGDMDWRILVATVSNYIGIPDEPWKVEIACILSDKSEEQLRLEIRELRKRYIHNV